MEVFSGSKFRGGGEDITKLKTGKRRESQVEGIAKSILDTESADLPRGVKKKLDPATQAAFDIGTALHAKLQNKIEKEMEAAGKAVEIEKFVFLKPQEFVDGIRGPITGFIDVAYKNAQGEIEKISDIKTTGETFAKFETIKKFIPEEGIELSKLLNEDIPGHLRQKLEDYRTQLNVYLGALKQQSKVEGGPKISKDLFAQIDFIPSEDIELKTPARAVKFSFDPARLQEDLEDLHEARTIVNDYVLNLDTELQDVPVEYQDIVKKLRNKVSGKTPAAGRSRTLESFLFEEQLDAAYGATKQSDKFIDDFVNLSQSVFQFMQGKENVYKEASSNFAGASAEAAGAGAAMRDKPTYGTPRFDPKSPKSTERVKQFREPLQKQFEAIQELQNASLINLYKQTGFEPEAAFKESHKDIQDLLKKGKTPPKGPEFGDVVKKLTDQEFISFRDSIEAWRLWRVRTADFLIAQAKEAERAFELARESGIATREYTIFEKSIADLVGERGHITKSIGKKSDIYTTDRRFLAQNAADRAGVLKSPRQIFEKTAQPFGDDEFTKGVYKELIDSLEAGTLGAPATEIKKIVEELADLDAEAEKVLENVELFGRMGKDATDAWDFEKVAKRARVLREALSQYSRFNLSDEFQTDVEKKFQVRSLLQYLKQIEQVYGRIDLSKIKKGPFGEYQTGAVKVPAFLPPGQQMGLQRRNIQKFRDFAARPEEEGGPRVGESFSYFAKVTDQAGNVLKNVRVDFKKYDEVLNAAGDTIGKFTEQQVDLIDKMQMSGGTFKSAAKRVVMWGAAATLVYGGVEALKDSLGDIADIEMGLAQLRMVMNPLETDFDSLTKSAVGFAKDYGVGVREVIGSMKIFAQQGLKQSEVINRTRVSTLASNVTTLSASDATEALTATMKVFGNEVDNADMALDAWSETEARHAITAADMANAIKKSAAAAKNAGFTFNELNGIVAGIGAVTRQTGKEVGTAMRFIARRIFSEKGPKSLAEINIPTVTGAGENRRGFDILSDLSMKWDELTNAQKLNTAQSLGGTRQYNALLVAMDNWDEVLEAIEDSTNSKGSAERRNVEIMKTYQKQLEQTKAAATELKLELGKFVLPVFKTGLKALRIMFEVMSDIPIPVKAAGVALTLFFGYASKGVAIFDKLSELIGRGKGAISSFIGSVSKEFDMSNFEIFGKGFGDPVKGLKTFAKGAPDLLKATGLGDLHSGFGKLVFLIKDAGDSYNEFLAATGKGAAGAGKGIEAFGKKVKDTAKIVDLGTDIFQFLGLSTAPFISAGTQIVESLAKGTGYAIEKSGKLFGKSGEKVAEFLSDTDPGLFKSIAPLAVTLGTMGLALKGVASSLDRSRKSAQDYAQSVYNARRVEEDQIKELTHATRQYDRLQKRLEKINKLMTTPKLRAQQQDSSNYTAPLLGLAGVQSDATKLANELAEINSKLVIGYDEQGDAILKLTGSYKTYIESLQRASSLELAKTDIDVLKKFTESLTDTGFGESIKRVLKTALGEVPGLGGVLENLVSVSPGKEMQVLTGELNELLSLREKYPLSDVFDQDINKLQEALGKVKTIYDETATDFKRTLAGIFKFEGAQNIDRDTIARLLADPELTKGFELLLELEPKITTVNRARLADNVGKVTTEDVVGSEILKRIFPKKKAFIDYTSELTAAQAESAGILAREGKQVASGDIVTFFPELAKKYNIAGAQAVVELKKGTDGVYEAFATYINSKTLEVEQRELDDPGMLDIVDRIFPSGRIQSELENRLDALNTFVAGAAAGLVGIEPKKFKKDFDLGSRFYSELPTTTVLQADKGFNIESGQFGAMPQLQQEWARMTQDFFIKPMAKYNREVNSLTKNTLDGLDDSAQLSKQKADELYDQQAILRNNQVVVQFAAVFADLSKTMEESSRALSENLAVEKARQESVKITTGLLKGVPEGFDAIDTGIRKIQDLSVKQLAAISSPEYRQLAGGVRTQQVNREAGIGQLDALQKARVAIETIAATQAGLGSIIGPEAGPKAVEGFIQKTVALQDIGMATLSQDINSLENTSSKGFGDVVDRLETMIANQGDLTGFEEAVTSFESGAAAKKTGGLFANELAKQLHKTAAARTRAGQSGDGEAVAVFTNQIDRLIDVMVSEQGLKGGQEVLRGIVGRLGTSRTMSGGLSETEFQQRAFRSLQPDELLERFKTEGKAATGTFATLKPFQSKNEFKRALSGEDFGDTANYKKLVKLQEQANKVREKSLLDAKTILKGSVAITTFEAFNKQHSSKVLNTLRDQLTEAESGLSTAAPGSNIQEMQKNIESLNRAIEDQEKNLQFHGLVASMTKITGGVTALSKVFGISETNLKRVNVGAVGLYLAMQAASKVTGKDMPESAKEFGTVLKKAIGELKEGDPNRSTMKKLRDVGTTFEDAYGERVKEATGKTKEAIDKQITERLKGMKDLSEAEIQERAKQLRKEASTGGGAGTTAVIAALSAATLAGTFYETSGRGTQNAELERLAKQTSEVFNDIVRDNTKAAEIIANELVEQVKAKVKEATPALAEEPQNQLLDVAEQTKKALELLGDQSEKTKKAIEAASKTIDEFTTQMYKFELISEINKSMQDFVRTLSDAASEFEIRRNYGGAGILNSGLSGFAGDAALPLQTRGMSTQQRLFSSMGSDFQDSVAAYSYGLQTIDALVGSLGDATKRRREFIENNIEDPEVWEALEREIDSTKESLNSATDTVRSFGGALSNITQYADTVNRLNDAFNDVAAKQAIDTMPGFRQYRDDMDKMLGGAHPGAVIGITPEQERMGRGVGVQLRHGASTSYDLERAQLLDQQRRSSGEEGAKVRQRLEDQPEAYRRRVESYRQRTELGRLKEQQAPFEQTLVDVQKLRQSNDLPEAVDEGLKNYQDRIVKFLQDSAEKVPRAQLFQEVLDAASAGKITEKQKISELSKIAESGPSQFRGTLVTGQAGLEKQRTAVYEALRKELPTREMSDMKVAIADPIVEELSYQTEILKTIAEKGLDIDTKALKRPALAPFEAEAFKAPGQNIFSKFFRSIRSKYDETPYRSTQGKAAGGRVFGSGGPKEDKVPAMLSPGEFVIKQASASKLGMTDLEHINKYGEVPEPFGPRKPGAFSPELFGPKKPGAFSPDLFGPKIPGLANGGFPTELSSSREYDKLKDFMRPISTITGKKIPTAAEKLEGSLDAMKAMVSFVVDAVPGVGDVKSLQEGITGKDLITGEDLGIIGSALSLIATLPVIPGTLKNLRHGIDPLTKTAIKTTTDFGRKTRWKEPLQKMLQARGNPRLTTIDDIVKETGLSNYQVSTLQEMLAGNTKKASPGLGKFPKAGKVLSKITKPLRNQMGAVGPGVDDLSKIMPLIKLADKKSAEFASVYPDVFQKVKGGKAKFKNIERFTEDPSVGGTFLSRSDPAENLTRPSPYEIALNEKILDIKNPGNIAKVINHEGFHAVAQFVKDKFAKKILDTNVIDKQLKAQKDFIDSFATRKPFTKIAEGNVGDANFGSENFAEFARSVRQGHIKSELSGEFNKLFDPKFFQTGESFAEGGIVGDFKDWMTKIKEKFIGRNVDIDKDPGTMGGMSYLSSKETKEKMLDDALGMAEGGPARRFTTVNGQLVELDEAGNIVSSLGEESGTAKRNSFLKNKAYRVGTGEVDIDLPRSRPESIALFAEEVATMTGRRMGKEATALHRDKQKLSEEEIMAAEIAAINREVRRKKEQDPAVRDALRFPGLRGDTGELGLSNLTFDKRRNLVGDESIGTKFQSYHDLKEIDFQDMKRGDRTDFGMIAKLDIIAKGMKYTAEQDPATKAALDKAEIEKKALRSRIFDIQPGDKLAREAGLHYGRETELLLPMYHKLKKMVEGDKDTKESDLISDPKVLRQYDQVTHLLGKDSITDPADMAILGQLIEADKKGAFMSGPASVINSDLVRKYIEQAKSRQELEKVQKLLAVMDKDPKKAAEIAKKLGLGFVAQSGSAGDKVDEKNKKELSLFGKALSWLRGPFQPGGAGDIRKADGGSIPFYQSGGIIPNSGPIYAHKGEAILPVGFAEGGLVENSSATASLKEGTIKLEDNGLADKIAEKIKEAIETTEIKVDEDAVVKVDITDVSVPVDVGDSKIQVDTTNVTVGVDSGQATIPVDISSAAGAIGDAITQALANATVDVNVNQTDTGSVGADGIDELSRTVKAVDDRILEVKDNLDTNIESMRGEILNTVQTEIASQVERAMTRVQHDVNEHTNRLSYVNGQITRFEHQMDHRIREVDRIAKEATNLAQRPPSLVPLV